MRKHVRHPARKMATTIRMSSSNFDTTSTDLATGETVTLDLTFATLAERERVATTLCELHGIGTEKDWSRYERQKASEAAERRAEYKARRLARQVNRPVPHVSVRPGTQAVPDLPPVHVERRQLALPMGA